MSNKENIEIEVLDALVERPLCFRTTNKRYVLYPPTLGKTIIVSRLLKQIADPAMADVDIAMEALRLSSECPLKVCEIIAIHTLTKASDILNQSIVDRIAKRLNEDLSYTDMAEVFLATLGSDTSDKFMEYFGLKDESIVRSKIAALKAENGSMHFGGKSVYGTLIDQACERYGWSLDYIMWGISLVNLKMLLADASTSIHLSDSERNALGMKPTDCINADDPSNMEEIRAMFRE